MNLSAHSAGCFARRLVVAAAAGWAGMPQDVTAQAGSTRVSISLDEGAVELIRASRRAQGLDPPDAQADRRVAAWLQRQRQMPAPVAHATRPAPGDVYRRPRP